MKKTRGRHTRFLVLIMSAAVVISGSSFAGAAQDSSQVNLYGNSGCNIVNGGEFTKQGDYIYFVMDS